MSETTPSGEFSAVRPDAAVSTEREEVPATVVGTGDGSGVREAEGVVMDDVTLKAARRQLHEARLKAKPRSHESELVVKGNFLPDRRLPNREQDLDALVLASARRRFRVGSLPRRSNENP